MLEHQRRTVQNYLDLAELDERRVVVPVLQGWEPGDHERCVEMYLAAGVDLRDCQLVGVGSICRRQDSDEIHDIIAELHAYGLRLHGFGVKSGGLRRYASHLASADSLAWSFRARKHAHHREGPPLCGGSHRSCANCFDWAHRWHAGVVRAAAPADLPF